MAAPRGRTAALVSASRLPSTSSTCTGERSRPAARAEARVRRAGQPGEVRNNDDVLHNVRVREDGTHSPAFNVAIPTGEKFLFTFQRDGFYDVGCDIHPAMAAQIVATTSPYVAVADREGNF